jgi:hypothetical protein
MYPCERVGLDLIETARFRSTNSVDLKITPGQLWQLLEEAESWPKWSYVKQMTWTSPKPFRVGTTRAVDTRTGGRVHEEVIVWHPQVHLAFRVNEVSEPPGGGSVEELRIEPTPQGCRLTWTIAHDPKHPPLLARLLLKRMMKRNYRKYLGKLRRYAEQRFVATVS